MKRGRGLRIHCGADDIVGYADIKTIDGVFKRQLAKTNVRNL